jgi:hypothetical protein
MSTCLIVHWKHAIRRRLYTKLKLAWVRLTRELSERAEIGICNENSPSNMPLRLKTIKYAHHWGSCWCLPVTREGQGRQHAPLREDNVVTAASVPWLPNQLYPHCRTIHSDLPACKQLKGKRHVAKRRMDNSSRFLAESADAIYSEAIVRTLRFLFMSLSHKSMSHRGAEDFVELEWGFLHWVRPVRC